MATRPSLPYYAPAELLPAPLPTVAEILAAKRISSLYKTPVVRIGKHYAVKYGGDVRMSLQEGENQLFVQQSTSIPVPKVYAIFHDEATKINFLVMEYIDGENLAAVWQKLDATKQRAFALTVRGYLEELRSIPSPGYYGGIWGQLIPDYNFRDQRGVPHTDPELARPHETEAQ